MINISFDFNLFNSEYYFYERLLVLLFSLLPTMFLVFLTLYSDKKSKEPRKNIIICLLSGILTISLAQFFERLVMPYFSSNTLVTYVFAFIEEISKIAIFYMFLIDNKHYDDIYDGVVYMMLIALSFAGLENIMYAFSESTVSESIGLALMRDLTTIPLHVICGIVIGYFISIGNFSKNKNKRYVNFLLAIIIPSFIHGTYNNLMTILGGLNVNYNNPLSVLLLQVMPLVLIMVCLFYIAIKYLKKSLDLNKIFIEGKKYDSNFSYLMNYEEYINSIERKRRIDLYDKISIKK